MQDTFDIRACVCVGGGRYVSMKGLLLVEVTNENREGGLS